MRPEWFALQPSFAWYPVEIVDLQAVVKTNMIWFE